MTHPTSDHDTLPPSMDPAVEEAGIDAPTTWSGITRRLGPGLIIAGSIVGSGELIATTKTGAQAGIALLWLIIVGCVIKVFAQVELGRYAISAGETTLAALDRVPGPRLFANWIVWLWVLMMLCTIGQLGGIVGGVGQAMALTFPVHGDYLEAIQLPSRAEFERYVHWEEDQAGGGLELAKLATSEQERTLRGHAKLGEQIAKAGERGERVLEDVRAALALEDPQERAAAQDRIDAELNPETYDDRYCAAGVAVVTAALLFWGRYSLIQNFSMVLVVSFTFITIGNVMSLQNSQEFHIPLSEFLRGLSLGIPDATSNKNPWLTALATFGIIGVGASELVAYPYWCLEKGYARFTGPRSDDAAWARRARGWLKVMRCDAFASMGVYTIATVAFYVMGVAVLHNEGRDPDGMRMVSTLATAYVPVFGEYAKWLFLTGAIAVLYSTFMVANASNARMVTDAIKVFGLLDRNDERVHRRSVRAFSVILPLTCLAIFWSRANPVTLILISGIMQAIMLPILGFSSIYFRYRLIDKRIAPGPLWDVMLIVSCLGLLLAGGYGVFKELGSRLFLG